MKTVLTITRRGAVTLPADLRECVGIKPGDQLIAEMTPEGLLLRPAVTLPVEICNDTRVHEFEESEAELATQDGESMEDRARSGKEGYSFVRRLTRA